MICGIPKSKGGIVIRKQVRLILFILFLIAILAGCTKTMEIVTPPPTTDTQVPATKTPLKPTATQVPATKTLPLPTDTPAMPTQTLEPSPTVSSINGMPIIELVSVSSEGRKANCDACCTTISADGRYVAFLSCATNLVEGVTNRYGNIYVHDRVTGETTLASVSSDGTPGNNGSGGDCISANGRYLAFTSQADNLVEGDTNGVQDCFVRDRMTGETTRVSVASDGTQANSDCASPHYWGDLVRLFISADGHYVAFSSYATNLVIGVTNGYENIYMHDQVTGETTLESVSSDGTQANSDSLLRYISADGRYLVFESDASNLVEGVTNGIFVHDRLTGKTTLAYSSDGIPGNIDYACLSTSADGRYEAFGSGFEIFVRDFGTSK
jgi:hypothetical protein